MDLVALELQGDVIELRKSGVPSAEIASRTGLGLGTVDNIIRNASPLYQDYIRRTAEFSDISIHLPLLYGAACQSEVIAELGTRSGNSTAALLAGAEFRDSGRVWSVDIGQVTIPDLWRGLDSWAFLCADDMSEEALAFIPGELDLLFIDTSHLYDHTLAELRAYVPRVRKGGRVLLHDTQWDFRGCDVDLGAPTGPVARALDVFCGETGMKWVNHPGSYGLGEIRV